MQPIFEQYSKGYRAELVCPLCGKSYLHHYRVDVFERAEDQIKDIHVSVHQGKATFDNNLADNPSVRRHGVSVYFHCEGCSANSVLNLVQHKGSTLVDFMATE